MWAHLQKVPYLMVVLISQKRVKSDAQTSPSPSSGITVGILTLPLNTATVHAYRSHRGLRTYRSPRTRVRKKISSKGFISQAFGEIWRYHEQWPAVCNKTYAVRRGVLYVGSTAVFRRRGGARKQVAVVFGYIPFDFAFKTHIGVTHMRYYYAETNYNN